MEHVGPHWDEVSGEWPKLLCPQELLLKATVEELPCTVSRNHREVLLQVHLPGHIPRACGCMHTSQYPLCFRLGWPCWTLGFLRTG